MMRTYLKALLMIVLAPTVIIAAAVSSYLWCQFAISLDMSVPARLAILITPSALLAAIPVTWLLKKFEEKH